MRGVSGQFAEIVGADGFTGRMADREHPREVILGACAEHGEDTVIDWWRIPSIR
jgi:hypothetical protein